MKSLAPLVVATILPIIAMTMGGSALAQSAADNAIVPSCKFPGARCGYVDADGKTVIEPQFDFAGKFADDRAVVVRNGLYGAIDKTGKVVVPLRYNLMSAFAGGLAQVLAGNRLGVVDRWGHPVLPAEHGRIVRISPDAFLVAEGPYAETRVRGFERLDPLNSRLARSSPYAYGKRWGIARRGGTWIVRPTYPQVSAFSDELNGLFWAADSTSNSGPWRLMRADGTRVSNDVFDHVQMVQAGQDRAVVRRGKLWGAVDGTGRIAVELKYDWLSYFRDGWSTYKLAGKEGRIDRDGNVLSEGPIQPWPGDRDTKLAVLVDGKALYTNKAGTVLLGTDHPKCPDGRHLLFDNGQWKVVADDARPISDVTFEWIHLVCSASPSVVQKNGKWGFVTADGKILTGKYFDHVNAFHGGIATVVEARLWSVIDEDGKTLLGPLRLARGMTVSGSGVYEIELERGYVRLDKALVAELARDPSVLSQPLPPRLEYSEGLAGFYDPAAKKWGFVDEAGQTVIAPRFDAVGSFHKGMAWAAFPDRREWCLIDKRGQTRIFGTCQCGQPLVFVELRSNQNPSNLSCYDLGLEIVRGGPFWRGSAK